VHDMTDPDVDTGAGWAPSACTLPTAERPLRRAEFTTLFATALVAAERRDATSARLRLQGGPGLEATVRDLAVRESACCSFFGFAVRGGGGEVVLDVTVPREHVRVLDRLLQHARDASDGLG
jgi:hypothetical protein